MDIPETSPTEDRRIARSFLLCAFLWLIYKNPLYIKYINPFHNRHVIISLLFSL